jgi:hypothetical protein
MANPIQGGYPVSNPDCQQGYTCDAAVAPVGDDPCTPNPCLHQGQCGTHAIDPAIPTGTYKCQCSEAFFGLTCETSEDDCGLGGEAATCGAQACVDCLRGSYEGYTYVTNPACPQGYACGAAVPAPTGCADDPRCTNDVVGVGFGPFFNPSPKSGLPPPPQGSDGTMLACALWPQAALDGINSAIRAIDPSTPPGGNPAETLCPATCKTKHCVGKGGRRRSRDGR